MDHMVQHETVSFIPPKRFRWIFPIKAALLSAIGGLLFGYDTGVISGAMIELREQFALSYMYQELIVSITLISAAFSALGGAGLTDWVGRKPVIILASFLFTVGAVVLGTAYSKVLLLVGRLVVGFGIGMASMTVPVYIAEISPNHMRGALVTLNTVCITGGQLLAAVVDGIFISDSKNGWRYMLALGGIPSLIQFFGFLAMPETPRWLVLHGRVNDAKDVLIRINGEREATPDVESELEKIIAAASHSPFSDAFPRFQVSSPDYGDNCASHTDISADDLHLINSDRARSFISRLTIARMLRYHPTRRALMIGCTLQLFQQIVGINTVMYYSASIISMTGIGSGSDSVVVWMAALVASANFFFCLISPWLISRFRRRTLLLLSLGGVLTSLLVLGASFQLIASTSEPVTVVEPIPLGFLENDCFTALTCDSCMRTSSCGFCYNVEHGEVVNGSCLPAAGKFSHNSAYGRCSNENSTLHVANWGYDHCPTPYGWITLVGLIFYLACFSPGMASLPWTINSELYPTWARSTGVACATCVNWISNLLVSLTFLSLTKAITRQGTYFLYAGVTVLAILFAYKCVPETGELTLEESSSIPNEADVET